MSTAVCSMKMLLLVFSYTLIGFDFSVLATNNLPSLQHPTSLCHALEKSALLHFKQSFILECEISFSPLAYPKVISWHNRITNRTGSADCCSWDGVKCDHKTGHVISLDLSSSCLYGTFPSNTTLFDLHHLIDLNLSDNDFNLSEIPSAIGNLYKLTHLNLSWSAFSGMIPSEISKLSRLSVLDLSWNGNNLGGESKNVLKFHHRSLEKFISNLTQLTTLAIDFVDLSSTIPVILSNRTSLEHISLQSCNLFGEFPENIFLLPNLQVLMLKFNIDLRGYLPEFHSDSPLRFLELSGTNFAGGLPSSLGNLGSLTSLRLDSCEFSGQIPSSIGNLTKLTTLSLAYNFLSGDFPVSITNLTCLTAFEFSDVIVSEPGILYSWLPKLYKLNQLTLNDMSLGNGILYSLQNLTKLNYLDLSSNQVTSPLPHWFMNLTQLVNLDMSHNNLQGPIPSWISQLTNLQWLLLSFNSSVGMFDPFLKLPNLSLLRLSGVTPTFPSNISTNTSFLKLDSLGVESCNLREFPEFLRHQDRLQSLWLSGSNIRGKIPQWLVNITRESLITLDLSNNLLTGFEQPPSFLPWNKLEILNFNGNKFRGTLHSPPISLKIYKVSNNMFSGDIPKNICNGTSFIYLDFSDNKLSGHIPSCIVHKLGATLQVLNLRGNNFVGIIPQTFPTLCNLRMINLSQNRIKGNLPRTMGNCLMLEVLDVGRNYINDSFPNWLGSLLKLRILILRRNNFHGRIIAPLHGHHFQGLRIIDISGNFHTGKLPMRYIQSWLAMAVSVEDFSNSSNSFVTLSYISGNIHEYDSEQYDYSITISNKGVETFYSKILTVFRVIDFSSNNFTGRIPNIIGNLRGLQALNLSNNNLVGGIPLSLANITDLEALDLSQNMLSGKIPQDLTVLTFLEVLNVSHNQLVGPIPQGKQFDTFDASSFEGNLALCGAQLSIKCENTTSFPPSSPEELRNSSYDETIGWIIKSLGCASGFIVGYVIGKIYVTDRYHDWFMETFGRRGRSKTKVRRSSAPRRRLKN